MIDVKEVIAVERSYVPNNVFKEAYGADVLVKRGEMTLLVRSKILQSRRLMH